MLYTEGGHPLATHLFIACTQETGGPELNTCIMNNTYGLLTVGTTQVSSWRLQFTKETARHMF